MTLFIFLCPSIQGFVDAFVFFENRIRCLRGVAGMEPLIGTEDSELDRTAGSVMIGKRGKNMRTHSTSFIKSFNL
jgi:hypothetical protein